MFANSILLSKRPRESTDRTKGSFFPCPVMRDRNEKRPRNDCDTWHSMLHGSANSETKNFLLMGTKGPGRNLFASYTSSKPLFAAAAFNLVPNIRGKTATMLDFPLENVTKRILKPRTFAMLGASRARITICDRTSIR